METLFIILGGFCVLGSALWFVIKWCAIWWAVGKGTQMVGNHLVLQSQKIRENEQRLQEGGGSLFSSAAPSEHGTHISQWNGSFDGWNERSEDLTEQPRTKGIFTVIPGGKR